MLIWFAIFLYALLLLALVYVWIDIIRLFISRRYRQCPPLVPSFGRQKKVMIEKISAELKQNRQPLNVLDPGCGTGTLLIALAGKFPDHNFTGIEWNRITAAIASFRTRKLKNVRILRQDMFDFSFAEFDIIACFLMQPLMERFGTKLKKECRPGTTDRLFQQLLHSRRKSGGSDRSQRFLQIQQRLHLQNLNRAICRCRNCRKSCPESRRLQYVP